MSIEDGPGDTLNPSESLDPDEQRIDADDDVVDPPENWSEANSFGTTPQEEQEGESLDAKIAEEEPEVPLEEQPEVPVAVAPDDQLSEHLVDRILDEPAPELD